MPYQPVAPVPPAGRLPTLRTCMPCPTCTQIDNEDGKALFMYNATEGGSVDVKLCTVEGLEQDTALVVVQGEDIYA